MSSNQPRSASPPSIVNVGFLCSGGEFSSALNQPSRDVSSHNQRLNDFHGKTLSAGSLQAFFISSLLTCTLTADSHSRLRPHSLRVLTSVQTALSHGFRPSLPSPSPTTIVNLAFLRSGAEFQSMPAAGSNFEFAQSRLARFYEKTAAAIAAAANAGFVPQK